MKVTISNVRGCASAELDLSALALVSGPNASGKSSIAQAVAAALSGQVIPVEGMKKSDAGMLVHAGTGAGSVVVETSDGRIEVHYPSATRETTGAPPEASVYALGLASLADLDAKARAAVLLDYLKAMPTEAQIVAAATAAGLTAEQAAGLVAKIADAGWDGTHQHAKDTGIKLKGRWEQLTGERYGTAKGETWLPADWDTSLTDTSEEALQAAVTQAREFVEAGIAATAVSGAERAQLAHAAGLLDALQGRAQVAAADHTNAQKAAAVAAAAAEALPKPSAEETQHACPHCQGPLVVRGGVPMAATPVDGAENKRRAAVITDARARLAKLAAATVQAREAQAEADLNVKRAKAAAERLKALPAAGDEDALSAAREAATLAERRRAAFVTKRDADRTHASVLTNLAVQALLAPEGLRLTCLKAAIDGCNGELKLLSSVAGWGTVRVDLSYGGRPWLLLSESERYRVRATLQVAMAEMDGSALIVCDGADVLDGAGRNGLIRLIRARAIPALVCMTLPEPKRLPASVGVGYWMDASVAEPLLEVVA